MLIHLHLLRLLPLALKNLFYYYIKRKSKSSLYECYLLVGSSFTEWVREPSKFIHFNLIMYWLSFVSYGKTESVPFVQNVVKWYFIFELKGCVICFHQVEIKISKSLITKNETVSYHAQIKMYKNRDCNPQTPSFLLS